MFGYAVESKINDAAVPVLNKAISWIRKKKEKTMGDGKYACPLNTCDATGFHTVRGVKIHLTRVHGLNKELHPPISEPEEEASEPQVAAKPLRPAPQKAAAYPKGTEMKPKPVPDPVPDPEPEPEPASEPAPLDIAPVLPVASVQDPPEMEPPCAPPEMVPPPAPATPAPDPAIALGTVLLLNGTVWRQNPGSSSWEGKLCSDLMVQVLSKEISSNGVDVMLTCRAQSSRVLWCVREQDVLDGQIKIVKAAPVVPAISSDARPADGPRSLTDPEYDYFAEQEQARLEAEATQKKREEYGESLQRYMDARDRKSAATKLYKRVDDEERPKLHAYIRAYGESSEEGKDDVEVIDFDIRARITTTPGETIIKRDTDVIIQWLKDNDMEDCLRQVLDLSAWEKAKDEGRVPADFVREVEKPEKQADSTMFTVTKL